MHTNYNGDNNTTFSTSERTGILPALERDPNEGQPEEKTEFLEIETRALSMVGRSSR